MIKNIFKVLIITILFFNISYSQLKVSASYNFNSSVPSQGFRMAISRSLPFQFPDFGIEARFAARFLSASLQTGNNQFSDNTDYDSNDFQLALLAPFYFPEFYPYTGLGISYNFYKKRITSLTLGENTNKNAFALSVILGGRFRIWENINPFIELQYVNLFTSFDKNEWGREISPSQINGSLGIIVDLNF